MKIATVTPYDLAVPGGVNRQMLLLSQRLRQIGHDVDVFGPASAAGDTLPAGVTVIGRAVRFPFGNTDTRISFSPWTRSQVRSVLDAGQYDVVHLHEPLTPLVPLQFLGHSESLNVGTFHGATRIGRQLYRSLMPVLQPWARRLDVRVAASPTALAYVEQFVHGPWTVVPNGVDVERFANPAPPLTDLLDGRHNILFVGRQERRKGLNILLRAYARIRRERNDTRLVVVGPSGSLGERYRQWVRRQGWEHVVFTGTVSDDDLPRYYQAASLCCMPAIGEESFGIVLVEAMAAGVPIVASDIPGFRHVLRSGREGLMVPPGDPDSLASAILTLLADERQRAAMGEQGRQRAAEFRIEATAERMLDLYDQYRDRQVVTAR